MTAPTHVWAQPARSRAFHIFAAGRSLCRRWAFTGAGQEVRPDRHVKLSPGDCAVCAKRFNDALIANLETSAVERTTPCPPPS